MASGGGRETHTADSLLAVAARVFTERGYDGTSMEHLAAASGLSKSSIYHHVPSKEALLGRALDRALDALFAVLDEPGASAGPPAERLAYIVRREIQVLCAELPYVTVLLRVRGNSAVELAALDRRRDFDHRLAAIVADGVRTGAFRSDLDTGLVPRLIFGLVNSLTEWWQPGRTDPDELAAAVLTLVLDGLRAR